jgi:hypothetical protein
MRPALSLALVFALLPGCAALVVGGTGALIVQDVTKDGTYVLQVKTSVDLAWASSKATLSHLCLKPFDTDDVARRATAEIDNSKVIVEVEAYDLDQSMIKISSSKFGLHDGATAAMVKDKILADLEKKH